MAPTSAEGEALDSTAAKVRPELGVERVAVPGSFIEMMQGCTVSAVHLEMRDTYTPKDPDYLRWQAGEHVDPARRWPEWIELVSGVVARGVVVRRARIVSEPVTDYIRYEHGLTDRLNIGSGELVRWLPRRRASDLSLPGNDFWVFDDRLVLFNHFAGDGSSGDKELREEPAVITLCASAFEAELRLDAGLTARALAADAGWDRTKVSQIEHARSPPAPQDVRIWCRICGAEGQAADLVESLRAAEGMWVEWRRMERTGLRRPQEAIRPLFERTRMFRAYSSWVVPGLIQTEETTRAILRAVAARRGVVDDVDAAVAVRMERQRVLHRGGRTFAFLIEESVLRAGIGGPEVMAGQLRQSATTVRMNSTHAVAIFSGSFRKSRLARGA